MILISPEVIRGYTDTMILFVLLQGESYGYEISKKIRETTNETYVMKETTLYSAFARLEKKGHIQSFPGQVTHGKPRTYYRITTLGKEYYYEKCTEWNFTKTVIDSFTN